MELGEYIKQLRKTSGLTQEELGEKVGVKKAAVQKWESGQTTNLKRETIHKLAKIFNVNPASFFSEATRTVSDDDIKFALFGGDGEVTDEMYEEIKAFAEFVKNKYKNKKD